MHYKKTVLENGLRVITVPVKGTQTATVIIMVGVGSRYESEKEAGLSHFIEHMFFKGTKKRPTAIDITKELDGIGGEFNAFTGKEKTAFYAKVDSKHILKASDVLFDMFKNSKIEEKEINKESGTITQEINMYEDLPQRSVDDVFEGLLYKKNKLGREVLGSKKTVKSFRQKDFLGYMDKFYLANETVICVAGKFDEKKVLAKIRKEFSSMNGGQKPNFEKVQDEQKHPEAKVKHKKTDQTHLIVGVRAYHQDHKDRFALGLLATILGGYMSSRLFDEVREKRGLTYAIRTFTESYRDCGYLATQVGVEHSKLELTLETILKEYKKISQEEVSKEELTRAKEYIKGKGIMGMESSDEVAMFFIDQEVSKGKILTLREIFSKIDKVTSRDILRVAKDIFRNNRLNLALIGPHKSEAKLKKLLKL